MELTDHDLAVLRLAARDLEGRVAFFLTEEGAGMLMESRGEAMLPAEDALPRLEALGLLRRALNCTYVLTPQGWDAAVAPEGPDRWMALHQGA